MSEAERGEQLGGRRPLPNPVTAGASAREVANNAELAAERLARKAHYAQQRAASFRMGAAGEELTAAALASLSVHGWVVLHDRLAASGGNIDHLLVGPGGVVVVDSKNWSGEVTVSRDELRVGGRNRTSQAVSLATVAVSVETELQTRVAEVPVYSVIALTQQPPPHGPCRLTSGPLVVGVAELAEAVRLLPPLLRPAQVDAFVAAAVSAFPAADRTIGGGQQDAFGDHKPPGELFLRGNIFLFVEPWSRSGLRRLYLNDVNGHALGFKDLLSGAITVTVADQSKLVHAVLADAHAGGLSLSRSTLPKIPIRVTGGRLMGHLGKLWSNFLIAQHWRRAGKDRLYVTHAIIEQGIFELGHIDLGAGTLYPSSHEPLAKDLREPRTYLERVAERYPRR